MDARYGDWNFLSVASVVLRASWGIMSRSDWKLHERQWIANIVLPIVAWMAVRIAYSLLSCSVASASGSGIGSRCGEASNESRIM